MVSAREFVHVWHLPNILHFQTQEITVNRRVIEKLLWTAVACLPLSPVLFFAPSTAGAESSEAISAHGDEAQRSISVGGNHACVVTTAGTVKCWGNNWEGRTGAPASPVHVTTPTDVAGLSNVVAVSAGQTHSCGLDNQGDVYCWGANGSGQLGTGNNSSTHVPTVVSGITTSATSVSLGDSHSCATLDTGELACWGAGQSWQIGQNVPSRNTAAIVPGLANDAETVAVGGNFSCVLRTNGAVTCLGSSQYGEVGANATSYQQCFGMGMMPFCQTVYNPVGPTNVSGFGAATARAISAGTNHACAVLSDGSVACWGRNSSGQLGVGGGSSPVAAVVPGVTDAVAVAAGHDHTCAATSTGNVLCWGSNSYGQLGDGTFTNRSAATAVSGLTSVVGVTAGTNATCGVNSSGVVSCWGDNSTMQLGLGRARSHSTPQAVTSLPPGVVRLAGGLNHACASFASGEMRCWGANSDQQIEASIRQTVPEPVVVEGLTTGGLTVTSIALGYAHSCASLSDGSVKCWGRGDRGQLGRGDTNSSGVPTSPSGLNGVSVARVYAGGEQSCLITTTGQAMCWGSNFFGNLGVGDTNQRTTPTSVQGMAGLTVVDIAIGVWHTCFMYTDGVMSGHGVRCVGRNIVRMLGTGAATDPTLMPTDVVGLTSGVADIDAGMWHSCALMNAGTVQCWGNSGVGEVGNGTYTRLEIAAAVPNLSGIQRLMVGERHTCVTNASQGVVCWGGNGSGQLGVGDETNRNSPVVLGSMSSGVTEMAGGGEDQMYGFTCVLKDATVSCWGSDSHGQAGQGYQPLSNTPGAVAGAFVVPVPQAQTPPPAPNPSPPAQLPILVFVPLPTTTTPPTTAPVAPPAQPSRDEIAALPSIELVTGTVMFPGQRITISRGGFTPGATVDAYFASMPRLVGTATADQDGHIEMVLTVPEDLRGQHSLVLYEPKTGEMIRQKVFIEPLSLPVTGSAGDTTDGFIVWGLFLLVFGVLGERIARGRRTPHPEHQR